MSKHTCQARVFDGWHYCRCQRSATIEENGAWWCHQHAPSRVKARRAEREAESARRFAVSEAKVERVKVIAAAQERLEKAAEALMRHLSDPCDCSEETLESGPTVQDSICVYCLLRDALADLRKARGDA